jgi:Protein of unknown function (DUF1580)
MTFTDSLNRRSLVPLTEVPKVLARCGLRSKQGKRLHISTVYRWTTRGIRGHQLSTVKVGRTRCTSTDEVIRFIRAINEPNAQIPKTGSRSTREARRVSRRARAIVGLPPAPPPGDGGAA